LIPIRRLFHGLAVATCLICLPVFGNTSPQLLSLSQTEVPASGGGFRLTLIGSSFGADSSVFWNGSPLVTQYLSSSRLRKLWVIGQGLVDPPVATGAAAPATPLSRPIAPVTATLDGQPVDIQFAGLAPGFVGLLQMNVAIPSVAAGERQFQVMIGRATSNPATISVGN